MPNQNSPKAPRTILEILKWTSDYFSSHHIDSPRLTAEILLAEALGIERIDLYLRFDQPLTRAERDRFKALIRRRIQREPVSYILGRKAFWKVDIDVTPDVLIPRPETEILVETALDMLGQIDKPSPTVLDLGTGSGAIAVAMASSCRQARYFASDRSEAAVAVAAGNAMKNEVADRIEFFVGNWLEPVAPKPAFDMIVSNPPYIPSDAIAALAPEICRYEPRAALDGDENGLRDIACLIAEASTYLVEGGILMLEIGYDQKEGVADRTARNPDFEKVDFIKDFSGHHRIAVLKKSLKIK